MRNRELKERFGALWAEINGLKEETKIVIRIPNEELTEEQKAWVNWYGGISETFSVRDAIKAILSHLGMKLKTTPEVPSKTILVKK